MPIDDARLLRCYAEEKSEAAFAELVRRHINVVYACALRRVGGDAHLAEDVAQLVFTVLARDAATLARRSVLIGWLYTTTRFASAQIVRTERRRRAREIAAEIMREATSEPAPEIDWQRLRPVLDEALDQLAERDREAILLRFFEGRDYASVGAKLDVSDNTARMRVERALEKLRAALRGRGLGSTSAALAAVLANETAVAAPAALATSVTNAVIAGAAAGPVAATAVFMGMTKLQIGVAGLGLAAATAGFVMQATALVDLRAEIAAHRAQAAQVAALKTANAQLAVGAAEAEARRSAANAREQLRAESAALSQRLQATRASLMPRTAAPAEMIAGPIYDVRSLDVRPKAKFQARPEYPREFRRTGSAGEALVTFVVDSTGDVHDATAIRSTHPEFAASAVKAVSQWKYDPGRKSGAAVNTRLQVPIKFTMGNSATTTGTQPRPQPTFWFQ